MIDSLPSFSNSNLVENNWFFDALLVHVDLFKLLLLWQTFLTVLVPAFILRDAFNVTVIRIHSWRKWRMIGQVLIEKKLVKLRQISWRVFVERFIVYELEDRAWTEFSNWPLPQLAKLQSWALRTFLPLPPSNSSNDSSYPSNTPLTSTLIPTSLPRIAQEWEELDKLIDETLDPHLLDPLTKLVKAYEKPPHKIDLLTMDLEDYFNFSGTIELRFFHNGNNTNQFDLRIFNRDDPLLITCPTSIINGTCDHAYWGGHLPNCSCSSWLFIFGAQGNVGTENSPGVLTETTKLQLEKNLNFLNGLWGKLQPSDQFATIENIAMPRIGYNGLTARAEPEMKWMNSMQAEFTTATFVVTDLIFTLDMRQMSFPRLQFVGVE